MSLARTIANARKAGLSKFWRDLQYIGDAKAGTLVGIDRNGNKYYEDLNEIPGRHRWVDFAQHDFAVSQIEPTWNGWLHHNKQDPPNVDPVTIASHPTWEADPTESTTGTRGSFRTYSTTVSPKIQSWNPKVASRS
ncbi:NADH:ubiquinone oxidoreductase, B17.2 subunit [Ceraceosorus bombacis]|uniref:NADH dehydrogenase [ubiquinone] 1 alpha subcomplex subunit n=1 Tax=Ceraceosorus bombacis TaxID=401625 RepID=A0A0P1BE30_9BASI|nr:NADH:ubiquinone oxidoreductase, B17.2 subunit [Ceraceosorus bombacis]